MTDQILCSPIRARCRIGPTIVGDCFDARGEPDSTMSESVGNRTHSRNLPGRAAVIAEHPDDRPSSDQTVRLTHVVVTADSWRSASMRSPTGLGLPTSGGRGNDGVVVVATSKGFVGVLTRAVVLPRRSAGNYSSSISGASSALLASVVRSTQGLRDDLILAVADLNSQPSNTSCGGTTNASTASSSTAPRPRSSERSTLLLNQPNQHPLANGNDRNETQAESLIPRPNIWVA